MRPDPYAYFMRLIIALSPHRRIDIASPPGIVPRPSRRSLRPPTRHDLGRLAQLARALP